MEINPVPKRYSYPQKLTNVSEEKMRDIKKEKIKRRSIVSRGLLKTSNFPRIKNFINSKVSKIIVKDIYLLMFLL